MKIRKYTEKDISAMVYIWNNVVEDGEAFPQEDFLNDKTGADFFAAQTYCGVADDNGKNRGTLYPASKQYRPLRAYCKCKLRCCCRLSWRAYR